MIISESTSSWSNLEFSPSLSEVVTRVCPCSSSHLRIPSSFSVVPRSSGTCSHYQRGPITLEVKFSYLLGVLPAIVQYQEYLDLFTFSCQRSDASKMILQFQLRGVVEIVRLQGPTRQDPRLRGCSRSCDKGSAGCRTRNCNRAGGDAIE